VTHFAVYIACWQSQKIDILLLDSTSGSLTPLSEFSAAAPVLCLALNPEKGMLYAALATTPPSVESLTITSGGSLEHSATTGSIARLAYLSLDRRGRYLLGASYEGNFVSAARLHTSGRALDAPSSLRSPGRHAHAALASPDGRFVYATSLGDDRLVWWVLDDEGGLSRQRSVRCPSQSGPRHIRFSPDGAVLYVLHEFSGVVTSYSRDARTGVLTGIDQVSTIGPELELVPGAIRNGAGPAPKANAIWSAELQITQDGRFLYATERTSSTIAVLEHNTRAPSLTLRATVKTEEQPRGMAIDPTGTFLLVCGEVSNRLSVYRINRDTGFLTWESGLKCSAGPRWIEFLPYGEAPDNPE
jgi:6-phosphogluconolactonase